MQMTIYPFTVSVDNPSVPLREVLLDLTETPSEYQNRRIMETDHIRIDEIQRKTIGVNKIEVFLMDFIRIRMAHGPGRGGLHTPIRGFDLDEDEGFCEETGAMYIPSFNVFIVQYNHAGIKGNRMIDYLSDYYHSRGTNYRLEPILRQNIRARLRSKEICTKIELKLRPDLITDEERKENLSVQGAIAAAEASGAAYVAITLGSDRNRALDSNMFKKSIDWVWAKLANQPEAIKSARISVKDSEHDPAEVLDLIKCRPYIKIEIAHGSDKRFPRKDRWDALIHSFDEWRSEGLIHEESQE